MITDTLLVVGPGGIGKSPLDRCLKADVGRIDPYRLRHAGPRDSKDVFYAHLRLRDELYVTYQHLGAGLTYPVAQRSLVPGGQYTLPQGSGRMAALVARSSSRRNCEGRGLRPVSTGDV